MGTSGKSPVSVPQVPKRQTNVVRRQTDYLWIAAFFLSFYVAGELLWPRAAYGSAAARAEMFHALNPLGLTSVVAVYVTFLAVTVTSISGLTLGMWRVMQYLQPNTPTLHVSTQLRTIIVNLGIVLPVYQVVWEFLVIQGYTKVTMGRLDPVSVVLDSLLWMLGFELCWYTQHRAMHDNKFLWHYGHAYHHQWKKPEHMIGITNFAFDAAVEGWVTMSSSFIPMLLFPVNWYLRSVLGLGYMLFAVLVHWDFFPVRYHLNHHYYVVKNYGSHWPLFDMFFGTYQGDYYVAAAWRGREAGGNKSM